jgi:hypothetical protein
VLRISAAGVEELPDDVIAPLAEEAVDQIR